MDKKTKNIMFIIAFAIVMYAAAMNLDVVLAFLGRIISLLLPLITGLVLAFVLSATALGSTGIWCAWPIGWIVATIMSIRFYRAGVWKRGM